MGTRSSGLADGHLVVSWLCGWGSLQSLFQSWEESSCGYWVWWDFAWFAGVEAVLVIRMPHKKEPETRLLRQHKFILTVKGAQSPRSGVGRVSSF